MKIVQLEYFCAVCRYHSITQAAQKLYVTQPAISNAIRELEKEFSISLFTRTKNHMSLTKEGELFYQKANRLLDTINQTASELYDLGRQITPIRIGIPTFAPEHFARVTQLDTMKRKQFIKGINQIAQEGAIQIFQELNTGMEEIIVGVVGVLQFDVLKYRLENEYNVEIRLDKLPYEHIRWIENKDEVDVKKIVGTSDMKKVTDLKGNPLLLFVNAWSVGMTLDRNDGLVLSEFSRS